MTRKLKSSSSTKLPTKKVDDTFAIQCFKNGKRKMTSKLKVEEARVFLVAAEHLAKFLKKEYGVK